MKFTKSQFCSAGAGLLLYAASSTQAAIWTNSFDNFTGTDGTAVSSYTDTNGGNPASYVVMTASSNWSSVPAGWLTQGDIGGAELGNKTAKFFNGPGTGTSGRARWGTVLPTSMDSNGGVAVSWRMRLGGANPGRGPIQICLTPDGSTGVANSTTAASAFFLIKNNNGTGGTTIDIQRNGGGLYSAAGLAPNQISQYVLSSNLMNEYHQWTAAVINDPTANKAYWKLWLDGNQLLFGGGAGSPMYDTDGAGPNPSEQFSFATVVNEGFDAILHNQPYIGLGDLNSQDLWDFDFDYVNYQDNGIAYFVPEPSSLILLTIGACGLIRRSRKHTA